MTVSVLRDRDHRRTPWRNGGGLTAEVASAPPGADAASDFDWRVSFADVAGEGDFSLFPDVDRVIVLVDGPAMRLAAPGGTHELRRFEPFAFDGAQPIRCTVDAPTRDLNVMTRRGRAEATVEVLALRPVGGPVQLPRAEPLVVAALDGRVRMIGDGTTATLLPGDVITTDELVWLDGDGTAAVVRVRRV
jgi:environmental stress-induced protein Ves